MSRSEMTYGTRAIKSRSRRTKAEMVLLKDAIIDILADYHPMTVRQVFYRMVARGLISKDERSYRAIQRLLLGLRETERIPYEYIADLTRWMRKPRTYTDADSMLRISIETYRKSLWLRQPAYVEIWLEKDALAGIVYDITQQFDVPLMVLRGFSSVTFLHEAALAYRGIGKPVYVYHLGDWDPSGIIINQAKEKGLRKYAGDGVDIYFQKIAVTPEQIQQYNLPLRPTKASTHSRHFDGGSVELDAIEPRILQQLVEECITSHIDTKEWFNLREVEKAERESLEQIYEIWGRIHNN